MGRGCRASPSSLEGRPGAARPSQPVDAAHRLAHPCCGSCSGQPEHAGTVGCASTPRPFLPHTPSFPDSSRRPSACRSEWGLGIRWQELRLSAYPCRRSGFERRSPAPCSCRPRYPARDGWGLRRLQPPPSGRRNKVPRGGGDRGSAALRDDYGGQRERSGIARAAVPRRAGPDGSSRAVLCPSGSHAVICVRPLGWTASCPRRGRRRGSTSSIDGRRGLTGGLLRSFGSSAALAVRCSSLLPTRGLKSSPYFRAGRSLPHTQADAAPLPSDSPQATSQPAGSLATGKASVSFGGRTSRPRRSPTPKSPAAGAAGPKERDVWAFRARRDSRPEWSNIGNR